MHVVPKNIFSGYSTNSEAFVSELVENLEGIFLVTDNSQPVYKYIIPGE